MEEGKNQKYRDGLASRLLDISDHFERKKALESRGRDYIQARVFKLYKRYEREFGEKYKEFEHYNVEFSPQSTPLFFDGFTGRYTFIKYYPILIDSIVEDEEGNRFFVTPTNPNVQAFVSLLGRHLVEISEGLERVKFPEIRLERINGEILALVEYLNGRGLSKDKETRKREVRKLTSREKAFLEIFNLWIGNWDFKPEHVLYSESSIGVIDFEKAFDYGKKNLREEIIWRYPFLIEPLDEGD